MLHPNELRYRMQFADQYSEEEVGRAMPTFESWTQVKKDLAKPAKPAGPALAKPKRKPAPQTDNPVVIDAISARLDEGESFVARDVVALSVRIPAPSSTLAASRVVPRTHASGDVQRRRAHRRRGGQPCHTPTSRRQVRAGQGASRLVQRRASRPCSPTRTRGPSWRSPKRPKRRPRSIPESLQ